MNIEKKNVKDLLPADYNPRKDMAGGEAGAEAILPLKGFYTQLAQMLDERLNMAGMERYLAIIADNSSKGIYLEDGTLVGHLLPAIDSGLAKYSMRGGRGNR